MTRLRILVFAITELKSEAAVIINDTSTLAVAPHTKIESNTYEFDVDNDNQTDWSIVANL